MVPYKNFSYNSEINLEEKIFSNGKNTMKTRMIHIAIERSQTQPVTIIIVIAAADDDFIIVETCTDPCGPNTVQREQVLQLMMT